MPSVEKLGPLALKQGALRTPWWLKPFETSASCAGTLKRRILAQIPNAASLRKSFHNREHGETLTVTKLG